jgi:hypothetical protein
MTGNSDRQELERRLEQIRRIVRLSSFDPLTTERFNKLIRDIEEQLSVSE